MKKLIFAAAALLSFCCLLAPAQEKDAILSFLKDSPARKTDVKDNFTEVRTPAAKGAAKVNLDGTLLFKAAAASLEMKYSDGDYFFTDNVKMQKTHGNARQVFDLGKNLMMRGLSHTLIYAFQGNLQALAQEQDAVIEAVKDGKTYTVTLTAKKKTPKGLAKVVAVYRASDGAIISMRLDECTGASTFYTL